MQSSLLSTCAISKKWVTDLLARHHERNRQPFTIPMGLSQAAPTESTDNSSHVGKAARQARLLARLARAPERNIPGYLSTGAQGKRSQQARSPGVVAECDNAQLNQSGRQSNREASYTVICPQAVRNWRSLSNRDECHASSSADCFVRRGHQP